MTMRLSTARFAVPGLLLVSTGLALALKEPPPRPGPAAVPAAALYRPVPVLEVHPFELEVPAVHAWRAERPTFTRGALVVLAVEPELARPRQAPEPLLLAGAETAERWNAAPSGRLVALVPGAFDPARDPVFFAEPALPEETTAAQTRARLARARGAGVRPLPAGRIFATRRVKDLYALRLLAADLVERVSPAEADLVRGWRAPRIGD